MKPETRADFIREELGCPGHFICASQCSWRRHTQVGNYRISSVGNYFPVGKNERETVGYERYFETMVFRLTEEQDKENEGCGCRQVEEWSECDFEGYQTAGEAQKGHERMVNKYMKLSEKEVPR